MRPGPREGFRWTRETILYAFELWHRRHLRAPRLRDWRFASDDHPSVTTVRSVFGSWDDAMTHAGLRPHARTVMSIPTERTSVPRWPREATLRAIRRWAESRGAPPTSVQWRRANAEHPSEATVRRLFGSWNAAIETAGFPPRRSGMRVVEQRRCAASGRWIPERADLDVVRTRP